jgi:hypothetical protein
VDEVQTAGQPTQEFWEKRLVSRKGEKISSLGLEIDDGVIEILNMMPFEGKARPYFSSPASPRPRWEDRNTILLTLDSEPRKPDYKPLIGTLRHATGIGPCEGYWKEYRDSLQLIYGVITSFKGAKNPR